MVRLLVQVLSEYSSTEGKGRHQPLQSRIILESHPPDGAYHRRSAETTAASRLRAGTVLTTLTSGCFQGGDRGRQRAQRDVCLGQPEDEWERFRELSSGTVYGFNSKARVTTKKASAYRACDALERALYHTVSGLPEPELTHRFC